MHLGRTRNHSARTRFPIVVILRKDPEWPEAVSGVIVALTSEDEAGRQGADERIMRHHRAAPARPWPNSTH